MAKSKKTVAEVKPEPVLLERTDALGRKIRLQVLAQEDDLNVFAVSVNGAPPVRVTTALSATSYIDGL